MVSKAIFYIVTLGIVWLIVCSIWPYWDRYGIETELEAAAIYGTKHSIEDTREFITQKTKKMGYHFHPQDLQITKNAYNTVSIWLTYKDKIVFLGFILKELEFSLHVRELEIKLY